MVSKFPILLFICLCRAVQMQQSDSGKVSGADVILGALAPKLTLEYCLSVVQEHWLLDLVEAVKTLNTSISSINTINQGVVDDLKTQLTETQNTILAENQNLISESQQAILDQLATDKDEIFRENERVATAVENNLKVELAAMEKILTEEILEIRTQQELNTEIIADIHMRNPLPTDCLDAKARGATLSGEYRIKPRAAISDFVVYCDFTTEGGGWTYVINRIDGLQDFYLGWAEYKLGFGDISGEHWLGLDHLHELTNSESYELLFEIIDGNKNALYANYDEFKIGPEVDGYPILALGAHSGTAGDSFSYHSGMKFTTQGAGHDNDQRPTANCAEQYTGAWWYNNCRFADLSGSHKAGAIDTIYWNYINSIDQARMMIRPKGP